jgi:hypothetical protein
MREARGYARLLVAEQLRDDPETWVADIDFESETDRERVLEALEDLADWLRPRSA